MSMLNAFVDVDWGDDSVSVTVMTKLYACATLGVPLIVPVAGSKLRSFGKFPLGLDNENV